MSITHKTRISIDYKIFGNEQFQTIQRNCPRDFHINTQIQIIESQFSNNKQNEKIAK